MQFVYCLILSVAVDMATLTCENEFMKVCHKNLESRLGVIQGHTF